MEDKPTKEQLSIIRRIAGGNLESPASIRNAAHNIVIGFADGADYELIKQYVETNCLLD